MKRLSNYRMRLVLIGFVVGGSLSMASVCSAVEYIWTQKADMPTPRWCHSSSVVDDKIYVIGGWPSEPSAVGLSTVEVYDPTTDTWIKKADMLEPRGYHSSSVVNGKIYIIGGCGLDYSELSTVDEYDPATDTWTRKADMPTSRFCLSTCAVDGKIYAIGGAVWGKPSIYDTRGMSRVEVYDPATDTWTTKMNNLTPRWGLCSSVVDGKIYVIGGAPGIQGQNKVEVYDPADDSWTVKRYMPTGRRNFSTSVLCGKIYAVGGWRASGAACFSTVEVYDPSADSWMQIADLPAVRSCLSTSVVAGKIYAIGGTPTPHPCPATSTVYEFGPLPPDFNGDGNVNIIDLVILIDKWGTNEPLCDITPPPCGDGIVDVQDLEILMSYWRQPVTDPTLTAHWELDETEGTITYDRAGNHNGILHGQPLWQPTGGQLAGALQFDGVDDYVSTPFVLDPAEGALSVLAWIKGGATGQAVISQTDGTGFGGTWLGLDPSDGKLSTTLMFVELKSEATIVAGDWHHLGLVWDGSLRHLYLDGAEVAKDATALSYTISSDGGLNIGADKDLSTSSLWSGLIDDIRIYNKALSPAEIASLAQ